MTAIDSVLERMAGFGDRQALYWRGRDISYREFCRSIDGWFAEFDRLRIGPGTVVVVCGDYSPGTCSLMFALMRRKAIIVPVTPVIAPEHDRMTRISGAEFFIAFDDDDEWSARTIDDPVDNELVASFRERGEPGLIVFTSGSTGEPKGILHDCERVMRKFVEQRKGWRTVLFLLMDHFGGFNTLLGTFAYGGVAVCVENKSPEAVSAAIADSKATLLPTTPTFLNLLLTLETWKRYDLSSIELITYGTELMPEVTLRRIREVFPNAQIKQTYGLSELGVLRSKSRSEDSVWLKVGGSGFETRIVDNTLWIKSEANMVGYLNAPSPFGEDGWMCTGDEVEIDGDYIRFVGRKSEFINVGGQKVVPLEVEETLLQAENIAEATVFPMKHPLLGEVPCARVSLKVPEDKDGLVHRLRAFCRERLTKFKIPMKFEIVEIDRQRSGRFKKNRKAD